MRGVRAAGLAVAALVAALPAAAAQAAQPAACDLGQPVAQRILVAPRAGTWYSIDALNPDVVRWRHRYWLFFSGNDVHNPDGHWRTGVAVSRSPLGPFRVLKRNWEFVNGGTLVRGGRLWQAATTPAGPALMRSATGLRWQTVAPVPRFPDWRAVVSDFSLRPWGDGIRAYFAGRTGPTGADIGAVTYRDGRWQNWLLLLSRDAVLGDGSDLGEPGVFRYGGRTLMVYGRMRADYVRELALAYRRNGFWQKCPRPFFTAPATGWYRGNVIDPEPMVIGNRLYLYFGGGTSPSLGGDMDGRIGVRVYRLPRAG
jgi:hypothetical protein